MFPCLKRTTILKENAPRETGEASPAGHTHGKSGPKIIQGPGGVTTSPTLLGPGVEPAELSEIAVDSSPPRAAAPATLPKRKGSIKTNEYLTVAQCWC